VEVTGTLGSNAKRAGDPEPRVIPHEPHNAPVVSATPSAGAQQLVVESVQMISAKCE
jgi:hypothetical protein